MKVELSVTFDEAATIVDALLDRARMFEEREALHWAERARELRALAAIIAEKAGYN